MKVVILAGGRGTRLAEETDVKPKPMVEVGGRPLMWHIMKHYASYGHNEFLVALGYKGEEIKRYFCDYNRLFGNMTISTKDGSIEQHAPYIDNWRIHLIETGETTDTGGRLGQLSKWIDEDSFMLTYGDGVGDIDLNALLDFHKSHSKMATLSAVHPPARFGNLEFNLAKPASFMEKPQTAEGWINGGFMVLDRSILELVSDNNTSLEIDILQPLSRKEQLMAFPHAGFWQCVDTIRDLSYLRSLWSNGTAPWLRNTPN